MIPIPGNVKLVIGLIIVAAVAALQALSKVEPTWVWAGGVLQVLTMLELYFTVPSAAAKQLAGQAAKAAGPVAGLLLMIGALSTSACKGSVLPAFMNVVQVVETDISAGKTDAQIASDVCAALGGSATTDAVCAGVETIVQDAIVYLIDTGALTGPALQRGQQYLTAHPKAAK